uniref:Uncharacterized protein n=1 Tax=Plectus sambesii TaxID=2011161 RepID=A0A914XFE2_9BILA
MQRAGIPLKLAKSVVSYSRAGISTIDSKDKPKSIVLEKGSARSSPDTGAEKKNKIDPTEKLPQGKMERTATNPSVKTDHKSTSKPTENKEEVKQHKPPAETQDSGRYSKRPNDM